MIKEKLLKNLTCRWVAGDITNVDMDFPKGAFEWHQAPFWIFSFSKHINSCHGYIETANISRQEIFDNNLAIIPPNKPYRFTIGPKHQSISTWSHISYPLDHGLDIADFISVPLVLDGKVALKAKRNIAELVKISKDESIGIITKTIKQHQFGMALLNAIMPSCTEHEFEHVSPEDSSRIFDVLEYIEKNLSADIKLDLLAEIACLSTSQFYRIFIKVMKIRPVQFVRKARITKACDALASTKLPIGQIAADVGYPDQYTFSRTFKKAMGVSPLNYRKNLGKILQFHQISQ